VIWGFGKKKKQDQERRDLEEQVRREDEDRARRREAREQATRDAVQEIQQAAQEQAGREAEEQARREAEAQARHEAEEQARREAEAQARREAEEQARSEAEAQARRAAEEQARSEAEAQARRAAEQQARREAEAQAHREAEEQARREAEAQARREAEEQARREAEAQARREAEEQARREAEAQARHEAEEQARREAEVRSRKRSESKEAEPEPDPNIHQIAWGESPKKKVGFFARLSQGLTRSSAKISKGIAEHLTTAQLDDEELEYLEDVLIQADLGVKTAHDLIESLSSARFGPNPTEQEVREHFAGELAKLLEPVAHPLAIRKQPKPHVVLVVGVNGSGKTTTIGKMAQQLTDWKIKVSLAAGDTFRAAAVEQLKIWGDRTGCPVVARDTGADAAGLAYDAIQNARTRGDDVLLIDTAGRLQNRTELMDELKKIVRVIKKLDETAPHTVLLVIDATVGQNALQQVKVFQEMVGVTGLVVTKLDGTAKGGVVISLAEEFGLPIHFVGVGEAAEDLRPFLAKEFAGSLMGV